jgi:hypothetical protein
VTGSPEQTPAQKLTGDVAAIIVAKQAFGG